MSARSSTRPQTRTTFAKCSTDGAHGFDRRLAAREHVYFENFLGGGGEGRFRIED